MTITYGTPGKIDMAEISGELADDIKGEPGPWTLYEASSYKGDYVHDHTIQIVYCGGRAGIALCGNGSSGHTSWTDCKDPADALLRYLENDMSN